jgi:hypothetical protein
MTQTSYEALYAEALADVEAGNQHACGTTDSCAAAGGCPRCFQAVMSGHIGIEHVDVFTESGVLRITTVGCGGKPCVVSFRGVEVTVHD